MEQLGVRAAPKPAAGRLRLLPPHVTILAAKPGAEAGPAAPPPAARRPQAAPKAASPMPAGPTSGPATPTHVEFLPYTIRKADLDAINSGSLVRWAVIAVFVGILAWSIGVFFQDATAMIVGTALVAVGILIYAEHRVSFREKLVEWAGVWRGKCPSCAGTVAFTKFDPALDCPHCGKPLRHPDAAVAAQAKPPAQAAPAGRAAAPARI
jgi:hypothetical protein